MSSFQNRFCITIKFSIIFEDSSQFPLNKICFKIFIITLIFTFSMSSFQNRFCITIKFSIIFQNLHSFFWTQLVFKESSIMLIFTFSISPFQNHFCIMIKFSIIFSESSQFLLNKIRLQHPGGLNKLDGITRGMKWLERCRLDKSPYRIDGLCAQAGQVSGVLILACLGTGFGLVVRQSYFGKSL